MAVLQDADRSDVWADFMRSESGALVLTKAQLRAAVDAADAWADQNAAAFNTALPVAARTALTAAQKARLLAWILKKRYDKGA